MVDVNRLQFVKDNVLKKKITIEEIYEWEKRWDTHMRMSGNYWIAFLHL